MRSRNVRTRMRDGRAAVKSGVDPVELRVNRLGRADGSSLPITTLLDLAAIDTGNKPEVEPRRLAHVEAVSRSSILMGNLRTRTPDA
jgi:hypothetical protein